jgi:membrane protease YdiL (CAAX protease family)
VVAFLFGTVLAGLGFEIAAGIVGYHQGSPLPTPLAVTVSDLIGLWIALVGGVLVYSRLWGTHDIRADFGLALKSRFDIAVGAAVGIGTQLILIPVMYLPFEHADHTLSHRLEAPAKADTAAIHGAWQIAVLILFLVIGAPIVEELFFRGLLLRSLSRWLGPVAGIAISALAFGAAHGELLQLPALVAFGLILGVLAHRTGRLGPGIVAHMAFNAVTVYSLVIAR